MIASAPQMTWPEGVAVQFAALRMERTPARASVISVLTQWPAILG